MIVYDCEIINGVQVDVAKRRPGIRYCNGCNDVALTVGVLKRIFSVGNIKDPQKGYEGRIIQVHAPMKEEQEYVN